MTSQERHKMRHDPPPRRQGVCDIAVLPFQGRGPKPEQRRKTNAETAGVEDRSLSLEVLPQG